MSAIKTGRQVGESLAASRYIVYSVAIGRIGDRDILVSGSAEAGKYGMPKPANKSANWLVTQL